MMRIIITESQNFIIKVARRDEEIRKLISKFCKRPHTNYHLVMDQVLVKLCNEFGIDLDDEKQSPSYLSLKSYIKNTYGELIKKELGLV
jgi:hypothetical protein